MRQGEFDFDNHKKRPDTGGQVDPSPATINFSSLNPRFTSAIDALKNDLLEGSVFSNQGRHGALKIVFTFLTDKPDPITLSRGIEALQHSLALDESISLRKEIVRELPKVRPLMTALNLMREAVITSLDKNKNNYAPEVALKAVDTLVELKSRPIFSAQLLGQIFEAEFENIFLSAVEKQVEGDLISEVAARCGFLLGFFKNETYINQVQKIITEGEASKPILIQAIKSVGPEGLGLKELTPELIKFLDDPRRDVQGEARYQLVRYHGNFLAGYSGSPEGELYALKKYLFDIYGI